MRRPPPIVEFHRYPVTAGTGLLAIGITGAMWSDVNVGPLMEDIHVRQFQLWRLVTSALPHADFMHIFFNLYWIWAFGTLIEETWGHLRTALLFLILAVISNGSEYAFKDGGIGLSGIGYGLFGFLWVLGRRDRRYRDDVDGRTAAFFAGWAVFCYFATEMGRMSVANIAHGMGAVGGGLIGWTVSAKGWKRGSGIAATALLTIAVLVGCTIARPWINFSKSNGYDEFKLGYAAYEQGNYEQAVRWYRDAVVARPNDAGAWNNLGVAYANLDRKAESKAAFERAEKIDAVGHDYTPPEGEGRRRRP